MDTGDDDDDDDDDLFYVCVHKRWLLTGRAIVFYVYYYTPVVGEGAGERGKRKRQHRQLGRTLIGIRTDSLARAPARRRCRREIMVCAKQWRGECRKEKKNRQQKWGTFQRRDRKSLLRILYIIINASWKRVMSHRYYRFLFFNSHYNIAVLFCYFTRSNR